MNKINLQKKRKKEREEPQSHKKKYRSVGATGSRILWPRE